MKENHPMNPFERYADDVVVRCQNSADECILPLHHPSFNLDEECMKVGIQLFSVLALED